MQAKLIRRIVLLTCVLGGVVLATPIQVTANPSTLNHPGRTLVANCFQCHGTDGYGMEHLAGKRAKSILEELDEMQFESARADIMNVHAQAYTPEELALIADYFAKQPK